MSAIDSRIPEELRRINWMHAQWKYFRRLLYAAVGAIWLFCSAGILLAPAGQFWVRMGMLFMLVLATLSALRAAYSALRSSRELDACARDLRGRQ